MTQSKPSARLDFGRVFGHAFSLLERNFPALVVLALVFYGLPQLISVLVRLNFPLPGGPGSAEITLRNLALGLFVTIGACMMQGAVIHRAMARLNDKRVELSADLSSGLRYFPAILAITLLVILMVGAGLVLLIVPGVILALTMSVAVPVRIVEGGGTFNAFSRSAALTRGHRWQLLAIFASILVIGGILGAVLGGISVSLAAATSGGAPLTAALMTLIQTAAALFNALLVAAIYYELRAIKEGLGPDTTVSVFD